MTLKKQNKTLFLPARQSSSPSETRWMAILHPRYCHSCPLLALQWPVALILRYGMLSYGGDAHLLPLEEKQAFLSMLGTLNT